MPVVDIYCRVSTDPQDDGTSMEEQERAGREYCAANGLTVGLIHREIWTGYQYRERKKLSLMRQRYAEGKIQGYVIRTLDRLSRSQAHVAILFEECEHYGATIHCVKEKIDDTPMGKFARMVLAFMAEIGRLFDAKDDAAAFRWLNANRPDHQEIVADEYAKLKAKLAQIAPQLLALYGKSTDETPE